MVFGLTIGTERATALQNSIQDELMKRGYSPDADPVMAEYITIMIINNKTAAQISIELEDLIGADFERSFTDWLFSEAAKGAPKDAASDLEPSHEPVPSLPSETPTRESVPHVPAEPLRRNPPSGPRNGVPLYQQAISQAIPSHSPTAQKRSASARSPSPGPNKIRRTDVPVGPRAMLRDGQLGHGHGGPRSLLERVGGPAGGRANRDDIQQRIDSITNASADPNMQAALAAGFLPQNGMDMNAMAAQMGMGGSANPMMLQEMMMNQMALMAQMATSLGMLNPAQGQFGGGFPMQGGMPDMGMFNGMQGFQGPPGQPQQMVGGGGERNRGSGRGGRGFGRGRGQSSSSHTGRSEAITNTDKASTASQHVVNAEPPRPIPPNTNEAPVVAAPVPTTLQPPRPAFAIPDRPQSPTLCKYALKCTNAHCRWSHPSPVATAESGMVLSNEACEQGKNCKDKDCIKAHVSPAAVNPHAAAEQTKPPLAAPTSGGVACRYGAACTRQGCTFQHPVNKSTHTATPCRFGSGCTRASCPFQHPEGRVLPTAFHRGLSTTAPIVNVSTPQTGTMGGASHHRSVTFNKPGSKEALEQKVKEIEEKKTQAEAAVKQAEAAAGGKKDDSKPVAIAA